MALPRSVKELSKLDFLPRHCESDTFRGFSFIGDGFPLPERSVSIIFFGTASPVTIRVLTVSNHMPRHLPSLHCTQASEQEYYWKNVDDDGQSLSECASSCFDDDLCSIVSDASAPEPTPDKKKRPPRKKKKNKQPVPPLETTEEGSEPTPIDKGESPDGNQIAATLDRPCETHQEKTDSTNTTANSSPRLKIMQLDRVQERLLPQPPLKGVASLADSNAFTANANVIKPTKYVASQTEENKVRLCACGQQKSTCACHVTGIPLSIPIQTKTSTPKPVTWASISLRNDNTNKFQQETRTRPLDSKVMETPQVVTPSSDWRTHIVSPHTAKKKLIQPPPLSQPAWPTLADFPPPPTTKSKDPKQTKPLGAWGKAL
jgi:hypothetical protein